MSAEDIEYTGDYKEFPTKESALDWLDNYLSLDERNNLIRALQQDSTTKNDLGVDYINKADFVKKLESETIGLQSWQKVLIYQVMDDCHSVTPQEPNIKALGEELRKAREGIADEKVLIGYNMAVAICNKYLGGSEVDNGNDN